MNLKDKLRSNLPIVLVAGFSGMLGGYLETHLTLERKVEKLVPEQFRRELGEFKATFNFYGNFDPAGLYSGNEKFAAGTIPANYWETRVGFQYRTGSVEELIGTNYNFSIKSGLMRGAREILSITNYDGDILGTSIVIYDEDHDNIPDDISIKDEKNNTEISIERNKSGTFVFDNVDEEGARKIFDYYLMVFQQFKRDNNIDERIASWRPKLEVKQYGQ
ncbi:hypothetical protein HYT56_01155 [Candidatus Woesearchaeota archaeon]|nr:hypothetical protein [Candidatus Woesearchaeota archaeon]